MVRFGREVRSQMGYILGTYCRLFRNVAVWYPQHNLEHYVFLGFLQSAPLREHTKYLRRRMWIPLRPPDIPKREDGLSAALRRDIPKPKTREASKNVWILA